MSEDVEIVPNWETVEIKRIYVYMSKDVEIVPKRVAVEIKVDS